MIFNRDKSLIISSVLFLAVTGSFLLGCSEGSDSSPVGALMTDVNNEGSYKTGNRCIVGTLSNGVDTYRQNLGDIPVTIYKYVKNSDSYVEIDKTRSSLDTVSESDTTKIGKFKFSNLGVGTYKISTSKTDTFKAFDGSVVIEYDSDNATYTQYITDSDPVTPEFTLSLNTDEINGLKIKVVSAHTGKSLDSATVKIDGKAVNVTNNEGIIEVNEIPVGYHDIEVIHNDYEKLAGKFQIKAKENSLPEALPNNPIPLCLIEPGHKCSITGTYKASAPQTVGLYKFTKLQQEPESDNQIEYYNLSKITETRTSYGIDNTPDGSFKFINLDEGFYQIYVSENNTLPSVTPSTATETFKIYNLSNYTKDDIANYRWQVLPDADSARTSRPINLTQGTTVYWTNVDSLSTSN